MNRFIGVLVLIVIIGLMAAGCSSNGWTGFYYKNGNLMADPIIQTGFASSASCLDWARSQKDLLNDPEGQFECGSSCELKDSGMYLCDETID